MIPTAILLFSILIQKCLMHWKSTKNYHYWDYIKNQIIFIFSSIYKTKNTQEICQPHVKTSEQHVSIYSSQTRVSRNKSHIWTCFLVCVSISSCLRCLWVCMYVRVYVCSGACSRNGSAISWASHFGGVCKQKPSARCLYVYERNETQPCVKGFSPLWSKHHSTVGKLSY